MKVVDCVLACVVLTTGVSTVADSEAQEEASVNISGQVLLPDGTPVIGCTVWVKPSRPTHIVRGVSGSKTYTKTIAKGEYKLDIVANGPIDLRVDEGDSEILYPRLSARRGHLTIDGVLNQSTEEKKLALLESIFEALRFGRNWNNYLPPGEEMDGLRIQSEEGGEFVFKIPGSKANLVAIDFDFQSRISKSTDLWQRNSEGVFLKIPSSGTKRGQRFAIDFIPGPKDQMWDGASWADKESAAAWQTSVAIPVLKGASFPLR